MKKISVFLVLSLLIVALPATAQETYFGKNKVQYRNFDWQFIQTDHFDIYFYDDAYDLAKFTADEMEHSYQIIAEQLNYFVGRRIPVFVYNSHNDFQQTNIIWDMLSEGTQGFTEAFKNRIVVHFMGSYAEYRHLLHHELSHAVIYDMLYGQFFKSILSSRRLFRLPLWFAEGYAEYTSNGGWTANADMMVRDATIHGYLRPPNYMQFLAYTEGFALVKYIVDNYGIDKLGEILKRGKALATMDKALKSSIGMNSEDLYEKFAKEMKKRYWPDISLREESKDFAKQLTDHKKDGSHYNEKPVFSPSGRTLAIFSDQTGYSEIFLISAINGKRLARLVKGERNASLESLRWYTSGMSFSPDGQNLVFVSKAKGEDAVNFLKIENKDIYLRKKFGLKSVVSPAWSPDGKNVVFSALSNATRNLYLYDVETDKLTQLTNDRYDDIDVAWFPDSKRVIFSCDRPHQADYEVIDTSEFLYGNYNLQVLDIETGQITPVPVGPGQNTEPVVAPDGEKIAFVSNRNGVENIYIYYIDSARVMAASNSLTNAKSPTWSPDSKMIAFSTFFKGGYDIYLIKDVAPKGDNGILTSTDFVLGKYDNKIEWARQASGSELIVGDNGTTLVEDIPRADPDFPASAAEGRHRWSELTPSDQPESEEEETQTTEDIKDDSSVVDTLAEAVDSPDTAAVAEVEPEAEEEDIYVYNAPVDESAFDEMGNLAVDEAENGFAFEESVDSLSADSLDNVLPTGEFRVRPYKTRFTPDIIAGGLQYDSFFGFRGQSVFVFSDYLGDHQILIATDLVNTIDQSNIQFYYFYNKMRVDFRIGLFHTKNYYIDAFNDLFSDRYYGFLGGLSWPQSKFSRIEFNAAAFFIDRKYFDDPTQEDRNVRITTGALSWTHDTVLWGITGPVNGRRYKLTLEAATPVFGSESLDYYSAELDYRQYFKLGRPFSLALRASGGYSGGSQPKTYFLGGSTNKIGTIRVGNDVYEIENLYFSSLITPLRGYGYYDISGTRFALTNMEIHFPFIDYFLMRYPLRLGLSRVTGALFLDMGAAWGEHDDFKGATSQGGERFIGIKSGFGFGARANLGFLVLRYDLAWRTDFQKVAPHTRHYFSLGADF
jgi:Tol biopolymer transport system component